MAYNTIKHKNKSVTKHINKHKNEKQKHLNTTSTITFLIKCRNEGITPNFIKHATKGITTIFSTTRRVHPKISNSLNNTINNFHFKILNLLIKHKHRIKEEQDTSIQKIKSTINQHLTLEEQTLLWNSEEIMSKKSFSKIKERHKKKFTKLKEEQRRRLNIVKNDSWFVNKTSTEIPYETQWLLSLGQKFALPIKKQQFPLLQCIADGENCIQTLPDKEEQEIARTKMTSMIENHNNKHRLNERERFLLHTVDQTKKFLNRNKNLLILNADKGNVTVAMEKDDYDLKMCNILNDMMTYRRINKDPTSYLQKKNNDLVEELQKCNIITVIEKKRLRNDAALPPRLYGLPKIHKTDLPLRPICSSINSPCNELCKFLTNILKKLTENSEFNIRDAVQFRNKINNSAIDNDERLISFDVISLFPSIPVDYAIDLIKEKWSEIEKFTHIPKDLFLKILRFCIKDNRYFKHQDKMYTQIKGLPMGSPASPVIADIVMEELLKTSISKLDIKPRAFTKYVDDLFGIVKIGAIQETLDELNKFHPQIKFTLEEEIDGSLPYLDTLVTRKGNIIKVDWYQKPTSSGRIINYFSNHPKTIIMNTANNLVKRVLSISDKDFHNQNIKKIKTILKKNDFPSNVIDNIINSNKQRTLCTSKIDTEEPKIYKSMTYIKQLSERMKNSNIFDRKTYKIAQKTTSTLRMLFSNTKSKVDKMEKSNVVYKIKCRGDNSSTCEQIYIGTTKNKLKTRIAGHRSDIRSRDSRSNFKTALATHCARERHTPDFDEIEIVESEQNYNKRMMLEMLHIITTPQERRMNFKTDIDNLAQSYRHITNKSKMQT